MSEAVIGIDTSNYTTSVAACDEDLSVISDRRVMLEVKDGERGLRQQEALFQHINSIPGLIKEVMSDIKGKKVVGIAASSSPRPVDGSYMPVFMAGRNMAESIALSNDIPFYEFSHQEGHVEAAWYGNGKRPSSDYVFFHLSGGTLEAVRMSDYNIVGKTLDISFGQLIDRTGVRLGLGFPCGEEMDRLAASCSGERISLPEVSIRDGNINLSGIENKISEIMEKDAPGKDVISASLFDLVGRTLINMIRDIRKRTDINTFLLCGGVSSSRYIRSFIEKEEQEGSRIYTGRNDLSRDNAAGIALLGGKKIWR